MPPVPCSSSVQRGCFRHRNDFAVQETSARGYLCGAALQCCHKPRDGHNSLVPFLKCGSPCSYPVLFSFLVSLRCHSALKSLHLCRAEGLFWTQGSDVVQHGTTSLSTTRSFAHCPPSQCKREKTEIKPQSPICGLRWYHLVRQRKRKG